jgi:hypothetical protein
MSDPKKARSPEIDSRKSWPSHTSGFFNTMSQTKLDT